MLKRSAGRHRQEVPVHGWIAAQLGVEGGHQDLILTGHDAIVAARGQGPDLGTQLHQAGSADEDHVQVDLLSVRRKSAVGLKALALAAVAVALHSHVDEAEGTLWGVENLAGEQDHAGACPQERLPGGGEFPQGRPQVEGVHELDQGRALAAGDDECVHLIELFGLLYDQGGALEIIQYADVGGKVALQPQDTYSDGYQPLVCSSWPSSRVPISMPGMASPRSSETRTSTSGSS